MEPAWSSGRPQWWGITVRFTRESPWAAWAPGRESAIQPLAVLVSVEAVENAEILFLNVSRVLTVCPSSCPFHHRLVRNLLSILARKNVLLANKMDHVTRHTTREKIMAYLSSEAKRQKSRSFNIPYNRQQMADYLAVERSALSAELSKLQKEGLIAFSKNRFTVILTGED